MTAGHECKESHRDHVVKITTIRSKTDLIDTQSLKNKILDLAIRGKLTRQLPDDGTAEELYEKIQEEKQALVEAGKIKKEKPLKEIEKDEVPFEIPGNWKWVHWGNIVNIVSARRVHKSDWKDRGIPFYRAREISKLSENGFVDNDLYISHELYNEFSNSGVPSSGDLMITAVGTLGKTYVVKEEDKFYYKDASVICFENYAKLNPYFLKYIMDSDMMHNQISSNSNGTTVDTLTMVRTVKYVLPLPPLNEQKRIVEKVVSLFAEIDTIEKLQSQYTADSEILKSKLIDAAIQGKLTEQLPSDGTAEELYQQIQTEKQALISAGKIKKEKPLKEIEEDEIPFEIPESWKWVRWGDLAESIQYGYNAPAKDSGRIKMVRISDIQDDQVIWEQVPFCDIPEKEINAYILHENDILFARTGGTVGKSYIVQNMLEEAVFAGYLIRTSYSKKLYPKYMKFFMQSSFYWQQLKNGTIATAQPNCNGKTLSKMMLPLPPMAEQERVVKKIDELMLLLP